MQMFARLPHGFMRRLRAVLRLAIPTAVAADTARSMVVTYQLAQQRFQEWEEEDREATQQEVSALLRGVVRRCAVADKDFFPSFHLAAGGAGEEAGGSDGSSTSSSGAPVERVAGSHASGDGLAGDVWQLLGMMSASAGAPASASSASATASEQLQQPGSDAAAHVAAWAEQEAAQLLRFEQRQQEAAAVAAAAGVSAAAAAQARVVVVSLGDAMSHLASEVATLSLPWTTLLSPAPGAVVTVTLSDVVSILGATPPARAAAHQGGRLQQSVMKAANGAAASARAALPWPHLALSRKSALRYAVEWHGWPEPPEEALERELAHY